MRLMKTLSVILFSVSLLFLLSAVPKVLNYQGKLVDSEGVAIDGTVNITFKLYQTATGGTALWSEEYSAENAVEVSKGLFSVELGSINPFPDSVDFSTPYWLETIVNGETLAPRERLTSAPYALQADRVTYAVKSIYTDLSTTRRTGDLLLRAGSGATLSDEGDSIIVRFERESAETPPTLQQVLDAGNSANNQRITNLGAPVDNSDAATKNYVDAAVSGGGTIGTQSLSQVLMVGNSAGGLNIDMNLSLIHI